MTCPGCSTGGIMPHRESCPQAGEREAALYGGRPTLPPAFRAQYVYTEGDDIPDEHREAADRGDIQIVLRPRPVVTLPDFLLARLAEEEERVRSITWMGQTQSGLDSMLRQIEARRRVVEMHSGDHVCALRDRDEVPDPGWCPTLRVLAEPYDAHPDYDEGWRL